MVPDVRRNAGKRVNTRGSEALVTWGVQFNRETLLEDRKDFHGWITFTVYEVPFAYLSCQKWPHLLSRTGQYRVVLKMETRTRRQQVVGGVRFTSSERVVHAGKFSRDVHQEIGQT